MAIVPVTTALIWPIIGSLLGQRRRRFLNNKPASGSRLFFDGKWLIVMYVTKRTKAYWCSWTVQEKSPLLIIYIISRHWHICGCLQSTKWTRRSNFSNLDGFYVKWWCIASHQPLLWREDNCLTENVRLVKCQGLSKTWKESQLG